MVRLLLRIVIDPSGMSSIVEFLEFARIDVDSMVLMERESLCLAYISDSTFAVTPSFHDTTILPHPSLFK